MQASDIPAVSEMERRIYTTPWSEQSFRDALPRDYYLFLVVCENDGKGEKGKEEKGKENGKEENGEDGNCAGESESTETEKGKSTECPECFAERDECSGGRILGYCGLIRSFDEADITNVTVREDCRRLGIGRRMLEELLKEGQAMGIKNFSLEVRASNEAAFSLYRKLGFIQEGLRKNFYDNPAEDARILWLRL